MPKEEKENSLKEIKKKKNKKIGGNQYKECQEHQEKKKQSGEKHYSRFESWNRSSKKTVN